METKLGLKLLQEALSRRTKRLMCNPDYKDRLFATKLGYLKDNGKLQKLLDEHYNGAVLDVHYVKDPTYNGYLGKVAIIFASPEDHTAFVLAHGHTYS